MYASQMDVSEIAAALDRPVEGLRSKVTHMGLRRTAKGNWTESEIEILKAGYAVGEKPHAIAARLGRPVAGVFDKAHKMGLKLPNRRPWTPEEDAIIRRGHAEGRSLIDIANEIDRKYGTVAKRASKGLGLDFTGARRKKRPAAPAAAPAPTAVEPVAVAIAVPGAACLERRALCLRAAGRLRIRVESVVALAGEFERWVSEGDPACRLAALDVAAARYDSHDDERQVIAAAERFAAWIETGDRVDAAPGEPDDFERLEAAVAEVTGVSATILQGPAKQAKYVRPRFMLAWCAREFLGLSDKQIGARLGGRHRTGIRHAIESIAAQRGMHHIDESLEQIAAAFGADPGPSGAAPKSPEIAPPAQKPEPTHAPARKPRETGRPAMAPAAPAAPAALTETEEKVLRAIIRTGKSTSDAIGAHTKLEIGPITKVLNALRRKQYIDFQGGSVKALRLPNGAAIRPLGDATVHIPNPIAKPPDPTPEPRRALQPAPAPDPLDLAWKAPHEDGTAERRCLGCGGMFKSTGFGNRQCQRCRLRSANADNSLAGDVF